MRVSRSGRRAGVTVVLLSLGLAAAAMPAGADHPPGTLVPFELACDGSAPEDGFTDVPDGSVHEAAIDCAVAHGLTTGTSATTYSPLEPVTRAQMASFVSRLITIDDMTPPEDLSDAFDDDTGSTHEQAINRLANMGVVQGTGPRTYSPGAFVTRGQLASYLVRAWQYVYKQELPQARDRFVDDAGSTHERAINQAAAMGITSGVSASAYAPGAGVRREQMARFVTSALGCITWFVRDGQPHRASCNAFTETDSAEALQGFELAVSTDAELYSAGEPVGVQVLACNRRSTELRQVFPQKDWFALEARTEHGVPTESWPPGQHWYDHRWRESLNGFGYADQSPEAVWNRFGTLSPALGGLTWFDGPQSGPDDVVVWGPQECKSLDVDPWLQQSLWGDFGDSHSGDFPAQWRTLPQVQYRASPGWHTLRLDWGGVEVGQTRRYVTADSAPFHLDGPRLVTLVEQREYAPDEPVVIEVRACNDSPEPYTEYVGRRDTPGDADVVSLVASGNYDNDRVQIAGVVAAESERELTWGPGECTSWSFTWDQRLGDRPVKPHEVVTFSISWNPSSDDRLQRRTGAALTMS